MCMVGGIGHEMPWENPRRSAGCCKNFRLTPGEEVAIIVGENLAVPATTLQPNQAYVPYSNIHGE